MTGVSERGVARRHSMLLHSASLMPTIPKPFLSLTHNCAFLNAKQCFGASLKDCGFSGIIIRRVMWAARCLCLSCSFYHSSRPRPHTRLLESSTAGLSTNCTSAWCKTLRCKSMSGCVPGISQSRISHWLLQHGSDLSEQKKRAFYRWYTLEKTTPGEQPPRRPPGTFL